MSRETSHERARRKGREAALIELRKSIDDLERTVKDEEKISRGEKERENFKYGVEDVRKLAREHLNEMIFKNEDAL